MIFSDDILATAPVSRFNIHYQVLGNRLTAKEKAEDICIEQTIEYPLDLVSEDEIRQHIIGKIESFEEVEKEIFKVVISYADEITGFELPQLLNVVFGNISMKQGIRVVKIELSRKLLNYFKGPKFGIEGIRKLLKTENRPLLSTGIKPLGLSSIQLSKMAYELALGGLDIIKDDHNLANQPFAPFKDRVARVCESIQNANAKVNGNTIYAPNISGPIDEIFERAEYAKSAGATGLLLLPGVSGLDVVRKISEDPRIELPIIMHPSFLGTYVLSSEFGISHYVLHGQLARIIGADASIIPNYVSRFGYSKEDCLNVTYGCQDNMGSIKSILPCVGGGIKLELFRDMVNIYGKNVIFLISGNLHRGSTNLALNAGKFREAIESL